MITVNFAVGKAGHQLIEVKDGSTIKDVLAQMNVKRVSDEVIRVGDHEVKDDIVVSPGWTITYLAPEEVVALKATPEFNEAEKAKIRQTMGGGKSVFSNVGESPLRPTPPVAPFTNVVPKPVVTEEPKPVPEPKVFKHTDAYIEAHEKIEADKLALKEDELEAEKDD